MLRLLNQLLFPPKCILCQKILTPGLVDLCAQCRTQTPEFTKSKNAIPSLRDGPLCGIIEAVCETASSAINFSAGCHTRRPLADSWQ